MLILRIVIRVKKHKMPQTTDLFSKIGIFDVTYISTKDVCPRPVNRLHRFVSMFDHKININCGYSARSEIRKKEKKQGMLECK